MKATRKTKVTPKQAADEILRRKANKVGPYQAPAEAPGAQAASAKSGADLRALAGEISPAKPKVRRTADPAKKAAAERATEKAGGKLGDLDAEGKTAWWVEYRTATALLRELAAVTSA